MSTTADEVGKRRTFAIISHPDAGKTTLTENLLYMGGAIHLAGQVKARGDTRRARSDWMKIEQERGISVSSAVMTFEFGGAICNLLDTPGHEDFSEDTYRTLTAADSAIMVIDAAKGIETQTLKLFEVCRLRDVPIITFINKIDREGQSPFDLMDEIATKLALDTSPMIWPMGMGGLLKGIFDPERDRFVPYERPGGDRDGHEPESVPGSEVGKYMSPEELAAYREEMEIAREGSPAFDLEAYRAGHLTPVYFGSALRKLGVRELLNAVVRYAPPPRPQPSSLRLVEPAEPKVSGFVFKVQANMDANHRDRIAFMRICSGKFKRGMRLRLSSSGKTIGIHNPTLFFAQDRELVDEAFAGDIIGIPNHGTIRVGDTLTEGEAMTFTGIPNFAPEILRRVRLDDPMKAKHMRRALESLAEEGVTQVFKPHIGANWIVGVVGPLQLEVLAARIEAEYDVHVHFEPAPFETARWLTAEDPAELKRFVDAHRGNLAEDRDGAPVFLAKSNWDLGYTAEKWPHVRFSATRERTPVVA
ncbi:MAG TPA: peptide chain release factor 3 [Parvibaculum sp.]|uniref:peptide chain release factor 3 n=1 Tax=Parvibaculum sp. TaxID=2024848 RepID=UPI002CA93928|nr:peptide chain release factor 3 [Parvibaculum sp.]HMM15397.1 peptide chain release factor 3 [Parvibaculum sp.]